MTPDEKAQAYADNISKDYPFNFSEELQTRLIKNDFLAGYNAAQEATKNTMPNSCRNS